jgi:tetratricopeptide (TPR) repeat protein
MKKTLILFATVLTTFATFAQAELTSAYNANKEGNYEEALNYINQASTNPKATGKEKYWRFRGDIYMNIAMDSVLSMKYANSFNESVSAYTKALEISKDYVLEIGSVVDNARRSEEGKAIAAYKSSNPCGAAAHYDNLISTSKMFGVTDTIYVYYSGICHEACGNVDQALVNFTTCANLNYQSADCYSRIGNMLLKAGRKEEAIKILGEARAKYPKNSSILTAEVNIYIEDKNYQKAQNLLIALAEADPKNESVLFVLGVTHEKNNDFAEAEKVYNKALEINPTYFDAHYNLAVMNYNQGIEKFKVCDAIPPRETARFDACRAETKAVFAKAAEHFKVCYDITYAELDKSVKDKYEVIETEVIITDANGNKTKMNIETKINEDPTLKQIKKALQECYRKSGQSEKANELK